MKTAIVHVAAYELKCPHCGEFIPNPTNYSHLWTVDVDRPETAECECGQVVRVPKKVREME